VKVGKLIRSKESDIPVLTGLGREKGNLSGGGKAM